MIVDDLEKWTLFLISCLVFRLLDQMQIFLHLYLIELLEL